MVGRTTEFRVKAGSRATLQLTVASSSGTGMDLSNTTTYATGKWKVWKPVRSCWGIAALVHRIIFK